MLDARPDKKRLVAIGWRDPGNDWNQQYLIGTLWQPQAECVSYTQQTNGFAQS